MPCVVIAVAQPSFLEEVLLRNGWLLMTLSMASMTSAVAQGQCRSFRIALVSVQLLSLAGLVVMFNAFGDFLSYGRPQVLIAMGVGVVAGALASPRIAPVEGSRLCLGLILGATIVGAQQIVFWVTMSLEYFLFQPRLNGLLTTWADCAGIATAVTLVGSVIAQVKRWRWALPASMVLLMGMFVNAWLFLPLGCAVALGAAASPLPSKVQLSVGRAIVLCLSACVLVLYYLLMTEVLGSHSTWFDDGASAHFTAVAMLPAFSLYGRICTWSTRSSHAAGGTGPRPIPRAGVTRAS